MSQNSIYKTWVTNDLGALSYIAGGLVAGFGLAYLLLALILSSRFDETLMGIVIGSVFILPGLAIMSYRREVLIMNDHRVIVNFGKPFRYYSQTHLPQDWLSFSLMRKQTGTVSGGGTGSVRVSRGRDLWLQVGLLKDYRTTVVLSRHDSFEDALRSMNGMDFSPLRHCSKIILGGPQMKLKRLTLDDSSLKRLSQKTRAFYEAILKYEKPFKLDGISIYDDAHYYMQENALWVQHEGLNLNAIAARLSLKNPWAALLEMEAVKMVVPTSYKKISATEKSQPENLSKTARQLLKVWSKRGFPEEAVSLSDLQFYGDAARCALWVDYSVKTALETELRKAGYSIARLES